MVKIRLSKKLMLTSDSKYQFVLNKIKKAKETKRDKDNKIICRKGDELLFPFAYYGNLESVLKEIPSKVAMQSNVKSLSDLIKIYQLTVESLLDNKQIKEDQQPTKIKRRKKRN